MSHIENKGTKGWVFLGIVLFFLGFIILWWYVLSQNMNGLPTP